MRICGISKILFHEYPLFLFDIADLLYEECSIRFYLLINNRKLGEISFVCRFAKIFIDRSVKQFFLRTVTSLLGYLCRR